jgi:uncharacterized protein (DUF433 family)
MAGCSRPLRARDHGYFGAWFWPASYLDLELRRLKRTRWTLPSTNVQPRMRYGKIKLSGIATVRLLFGDLGGISMDKSYRTIITINPNIRSGKPTIRGLRYTVYDILSYLAAGMSVAEILDDFPDLTEEDIQACLSFAADRDHQILVAVA